MVGHRAAPSGFVVSLSLSRFDAKYEEACGLWAPSSSSPPPRDGHHATCSRPKTGSRQAY